MYDEKRRNGELAAAREDSITEGLAEGLSQGLTEGHAEAQTDCSTLNVPPVAE